MSQREQNFQNIAWFRDLATRGLLNLDPPYQRRSVWNQKYREDFVDTILLDYPAPALFVYERIGDDGVPNFAVVDGKQRLETIIHFIGNRFPVGEKSPIEAYRGLYYDGLPKEARLTFLRYRFSVEYLPSANETEIDSIFDRLNRNVMKLTPQELRHARFDGPFITAAESLSEWLTTIFNQQIPRIGEASRRQMKDIEIVATLLLCLEEGVKSYSVTSLDEAFSKRDENWDGGQEFQREFRSVIQFIASIMSSAGGESLATTRFRNQADFYSLFAAIAELQREGELPDPGDAAIRLKGFNELLEQSHEMPERAFAYYDAARSASNDAGPRKTRTSVLKDVLLGVSLGNANDSSRG